MRVAKLPPELHPNLPLSATLPSASRTLFSLPPTATPQQWRRRRQLLRQRRWPTQSSPPLLQECPTVQKKKSVRQNSRLKTTTLPACAPDDRLPAATTTPTGGTVATSAPRSTRVRALPGHLLKPRNRGAGGASLNEAARRAGARRPARQPTARGRADQRGCPPCPGTPPNEAARRARPRRRGRLPAARGRAAEPGCPRRGCAPPSQAARRAGGAQASQAARRADRHYRRRAPKLSPPTRPCAATTTPSPPRRARNAHTPNPPSACLPHRNAFRLANPESSQESQRSNTRCQRGHPTWKPLETELFELTGACFGSLGLSRTICLTIGPA